MCRQRLAEQQASIPLMDSGHCLRSNTGSRSSGRALPSTLGLATGAARREGCEGGLPRVSSTLSVTDSYLSRSPTASRTDTPGSSRRPSAEFDRLGDKDGAKDKSTDVSTL